MSCSNTGTYESYYDDACIVSYTCELVRITEERQAYVIKLLR